MNRLLCVWLPNWPIQRRRHQQTLLESTHILGEKNELERAASELGDEQSESRQLVGKTPILVWGEHRRRGRRVLACCPKARASGVRIGMPIAQASEWCVAKSSQNPMGVLPEVLPHDPGEDLKVLQQLAEKFHHHVSPLVAIETIDKKMWSGYPRHQSESLICEVSGIAHLHGGEAGLLTKITQMLDTLGLAARMAIADHQGTAWAVAHGMTDQIKATLIRSQDHLPPRCTIVPPGQLEAGQLDASQTQAGQSQAKQCQAKAFIEPLCITTLRIDEPTAMSLERLGVETIGQLLKLPRSGLAARLGTLVVKRIQEVLGESDPPLDIHRIPVEHCETWRLEYPTTDQAILQDRITRLMKRIRAGLVTRKRGALRLTCRLNLSIHPPLILQIGLFAPTTDVDHLCGLIFGRLETLHLPDDINSITLSINLTGLIRTTQVTLLDDPLESSPEKAGSSISRLVDSLSSRLGPDRVVRVHLQKDPLPETAYRAIPLAGNLITNKTSVRWKSGSAF